MCLRGRDVDAREYGRVARSGGVEDSRVGHIGELHRRGGLHVVLAPSQNIHIHLLSSHPHALEV